MSAPWEVWCEFPHGEGHTGMARLAPTFAATEQYLHASLLCGDCASLDYDHRMRYCKKRALRVGESEPACMAFVPKEDQK